jgi:Tfp pilus assembly protein PilF
LRASPLMDEAGFVQELEKVFQTIWRARLEEPAEAALDEAALAGFWNQCLAQDDHAKAIGRLGEALARKGESPALRYMLGCTFEDLGRWEEAAASYRKALEVDPRHAKAANNLGVVLQNRGLWQEAEQAYGRALAADPTLALAHCNRGKLRVLAGRFAEAETDLRRAVELQPGEAAWQEMLRDCVAAARKAAAGLGS